MLKKREIAKKIPKNVTVSKLLGIQIGNLKIKFTDHWGLDWEQYRCLNFLSFSGEPEIWDLLRLGLKKESKK